MRKIKLTNLIAIALFLVGCSRMQESYYYLKGAELAKSHQWPEHAFLKSRPEPVGLMLNGHYVKTGNNLVLLIRRFDRGEFFTLDDEIYEKLTIEIRRFDIGVPIRLGSSDIDFYYSRGSSGFAYRGHGFYSTSGSGALTIKQIEQDKITAAMDFSILAKATGAFADQEKTIHIVDTLVFEEKSVGELTPWLGLPSPSIGKEVYPQ